MARKIIFFFVSSLFVFAVTIFFRLGGYKSVEVSLKTFPAMSLLYKEHLGPYNEIERTIEEVELWARTHNVECTQTFGEFLDDPRTGDERRLRARAGCVMNIAPADSGPYAVESREAGNYVWASFDGAPSIGPFKVYPKINAYIAEHHLSVIATPMETYTIKDGGVITQYLFQVK